MSYLTKSKPRPARARRPPRRGIGDLWDSLMEGASHGNPEIAAFLAGNSAEAQCLASAQAQTAGFDAKTNDLAKNWNPTGYYAPDDVTNLVGNTLSILRQATDALGKAMSLSIAPDARDALAQFLTKTQSKMSDSLAYSQAVGAAHAGGANVIDSPGLRRWVLDSMTQASAALDAAAYVSCLQPWWASALGMFQSAFDLLYGVARAIVGLSVAIVEAAAGAIIKVPDLLSTLFTYGKWAAVAGGAWWLYTQVKKR